MIAPVDTQIAQVERCTTSTHLKTSKKDHGDKSIFSFNLALDNVYDEIVHINGVASPSILESLVQVQEENAAVPFTVEAPPFGIPLVYH